MNGVTCCWLQYLERFFGIRLSWIQLCYRWIVDSWQRSTVTDGSVNTIPQMTCFRGAKVCTKWLQGKVMMNWHSMTTRWEFGTRIGKFRKVDWKGWVLRWLRDCRGNVAGTERTDVLWLSSWSIASHGQCCSERICRRVGVVKVKSLEVRTLWLQQVVKAKALTLKTVKLLDMWADLGTKTLTAGALSLLRNLNGLVDKNAMDNFLCGVQSITISPSESRMLRATALEVLERTLDEIARNNLVTSRSEKMMGGLESEQLFAMCANSLQGWGRWKSSWRCVNHREIYGSACAFSETVVVPVLFPWLMGWSESEHAGGVHEICGILSLSWVLSCWCPDLTC